MNDIKTIETVTTIVIICIILSTIIQIAILIVLNKIKEDISHIKLMSGTKINPNNTQIQQEKVFCSNCGTKYDKNNDQQFCIVCGNNLK